MVLDRVHSQFDGSLNDLSNYQLISDEMKDEFRHFRHFRPAPTVETQNTEVTESNDSTYTTNSNSGGEFHSVVTICADDDEEQCQTYDSNSVIDNLFVEGGLDGFRMPSSKCFSPPSVTNSCVNVIGDASPSLDKIDVDWWNYFEPVNEVENVTQVVNSSREEHGKKSQLNLHLNGINSSPAVNDSPLWKVSKGASLPSNDW